MVLATITTYTDGFTIELNDLAVDRKKAKIKYSEIRSLALPNNDTEVQIIFSNGELQTFHYYYISTVNGVDVVSQADLFNKLDAVIFAV